MGNMDHFSNCQVNPYLAFFQSIYAVESALDRNSLSWSSDLNFGLFYFIISRIHLCEEPLVYMLGAFVFIIGIVRKHLHEELWQKHRVSFCCYSA